MRLRVVLTLSPMPGRRQAFNGEREAAAAEMKTAAEGIRGGGKQSDEIISLWRLLSRQPVSRL